LTNFSRVAAAVVSPPEEGKRQRGQGSLLHNFFGVVDTRFCWGFWQNGCQTWCFGGEFVVLCVVNVVLSRHFFGLEKYATDSGFILRVSRFGNMVYVFTQCHQCGTLR
jgi:hypothetical protein